MTKFRFNSALITGAMISSCESSLWRHHQSQQSWLQIGAAFALPSSSTVQHSVTRVPVGLAAFLLPSRLPQKHNLHASGALSSIGQDGSAFSGYQLTTASQGSALSISGMQFKPIQRSVAVPAVAAAQTAQPKEGSLYASQWQVAQSCLSTCTSAALSGPAIAWKRGNQTGTPSTTTSAAAVAEVLQQLQYIHAGEMWTLQTRGGLAGSGQAPGAFKISVSSAAVTGLIRVAAQELPASQLRHVDIAPNAADCPMLNAEISTDAFGSVHNGGAVLAPLLSPAEQPGKMMKQMSQGVIITGGLGGIGSLAGAWAAQQPSVGHVWLLGRSGRSSGGSPPAVVMHATWMVTAAMCNTAYAADIAGVAATISRHAVIGACMHAGGVTRDAALANQNARQLREVLAPKVDGAKNLAALLWGQSVGAEVAFSSLSALLGTAGQANYAAANMVLDSLAEQRQAAGNSFQAVMSLSRLGLLV